MDHDEPRSAAASVPEAPGWYAAAIPALLAALVAVIALAAAGAP